MKEYDEYRKQACPIGCGVGLELLGYSFHRPDAADLTKVFACTALPFAQWAEQRIMELSEQVTALERDRERLDALSTLAAYTLRRRIHIRPNGHTEINEGEGWNPCNWAIGDTLREAIDAMQRAAVVPKEQAK